ncbi:Uncharacterised protein [Mycobacteroides abscessus subsp. abscessus]|nr:Uncharacterised protein [Mycobacteroides abscessus subsp. abscessus]
MAEYLRLLYYQMTNKYKLFFKLRKNNLRSTLLLPRLKMRKPLWKLKN